MMTIEELLGELENRVVEGYKVLNILTATPGADGTYVKYGITICEELIEEIKGEK